MLATSPVVGVQRLSSRGRVSSHALLSGNWLSRPLTSRRRTCSLSCLKIPHWKNYCPPARRGIHSHQITTLSACRYAGLQTDLHLYLSKIRAPNLTVLSISKMYQNPLFLSALCDLLLPLLQEFRLSSSRMDNTSRPLGFLKYSPFIRRITFSDCFPRIHRGTDETASCER